MTVVERHTNGSMSVTTITHRRRKRRNYYVVVYDVYLVGKRGWRDEVEITPSNLKLRQYTAAKQERIAEAGYWSPNE